MFYAWPETMLGTRPTGCLNIPRMHWLQLPVWRKRRRRRERDQARESERADACMNGIVLPRFNWDRYSNLVCYISPSLHLHVCTRTYRRVDMHLIIAFAILSLEERESRRKAPVTINQCDEIESDLLHSDMVPFF